MTLSLPFWSEGERLNHMFPHLSSLSDHLDRAFVVFKYLDISKNDTVTVSSILQQFGAEIPEDLVKISFKDLLESIHHSGSSNLSMNST